MYAVFMLLWALLITPLSMRLFVVWHGLSSLPGGHFLLSVSGLRALVFLQLQIQNKQLQLRCEWHGHMHTFVLHRRKRKRASRIKLPKQRVQRIRKRALHLLASILDIRLTIDLGLANAAQTALACGALTAMLGLTGLPMGIAAIACFGGAFSNGILFAKLKLGDRSSVIAVMLEPLTQAHIITRYPIPVYASSFIGGALSGIPAALLGIIDNAPGTASPIPGLLAPFAFNPTGKVLLALALSVVMGVLGGLIGATLFKRFTVEKEAETGAVLPQAVAASEA